MITGGWQFNAQTVKLYLFRLFRHNMKKTIVMVLFLYHLFEQGASSIKLLTQKGLVLMSARLEEGS
jgi:hypothetical protein